MSFATPVWRPMIIIKLGSARATISSTQPFMVAGTP